MPEERRADDPAEWLRRARSNLARAKADASLEGVYLEDLCFDAQQAAEKALKAVLLHLEVDFPYTHELAVLIKALREEGIGLPQNVEQASRLTPFAVDTRYPGGAEPVTREDYENAVAIAERVVRWAEERILGGSTAV